MPQIIIACFGASALQRLRRNDLIQIYGVRGPSGAATPFLLFPPSSLAYANGFSDPNRSTLDRSFH
jgi:hypothetical protein